MHEVLSVLLKFSADFSHFSSLNNLLLSLKFQVNVIVLW